MNAPFNFFRGTPPAVIPELLRSEDLLRDPAPLPPPARRGSIELPPCWSRSPPTYHAFAWVYRAPLMRKLVDSFARRQPPPEPLDIWVWEAAAAHAMLGKAVCLASPIIDRGAMQSVKDAQDDPKELQKIYRERGHV